MIDTQTKIQFIGTGDAFGTAGRKNTCFHITTSEFSFLVDCGASSLPALNEYGIDTNSIDAIVLTHFHGDHFGGLPFFLLEAKHLKQRTRPLTIIGPDGVEEMVYNALESLYPGTTPLEPSFELLFKDYEAGDNIKLAEDISLMPFQVVHAPASLPHGLRITIKGRHFGFSGDTEWTDNLYDIAEDTVLFVCECNFMTPIGKNHINLEVLTENASRLKTKRIVLNHCGPEMLENEANISFEIAAEGQIIEF